MEPGEYLETFRGEIVVTSLFWDCECDKDFIHSKRHEACPICGAVREDQPDSRANEVLLICPELLTEQQRKSFIEALEWARKLSSGHWG